MTSIFDAFPNLAAYQPSFLALLILCLSVLILSFMTAPLAFANGQQGPGMPLKGDHTILSFRAVRAHTNAVESLPAFGLTVIAAVLIGVWPSAVNWMVCVHVAFRLLFSLVYYSGVGKVAGGPRTLCYVGGLLSNIALTGTCLYALLF